VRFEGNSILPKNLKLDFFPLKLDFSPIKRFFGHFAQTLHFMMDFRGKFEWGDPFYAIFINKIFGKGKILQLLSINRGNPSKNELKLVFKMLKLVFKTPKLPCPAFSLQGLGWIPHKKSLHPDPLLPPPEKYFYS